MPNDAQADLHKRDHAINISGEPNTYSDAAAKAKKMPWCIYVMMYTLCITIGFVALKYHVNPEKLFVDNVVPLWCFIASTGFYWLVAEAMKKSTLNPDGNRFLILNLAALASGLLSVLSQISLIFLTYPDSIVPLLVWIPMPVAFVFWQIYYYTCQKFL
ncbi:hypothetical protein ABFS83_02G146500 [Erythranthe nasuta]